MGPARSIKGTKIRSWFKPARGGQKISLLKDYPVASGHRKGPGSPDSPVRHRGKWQVKGPGNKPTGPETGEKQEDQMTKVIESPVFIPYTRDSRLKKALQTIDETLCQCLGSPKVKFVERYGGQTIVELLGASNPWAKGLRCDRNNYLPCQGKELLIMEEVLCPVPEPGQPNPPKPSREETKSLPNCTTKGVGYYIEYWQ